MVSMMAGQLSESSLHDGCSLFGDHPRVARATAGTKGPLNSRHRPTVTGKSASGKDTGVYRLRVGDWRLLFTETGEVITVIKVAPRGGAYQ